MMLSVVAAQKTHTRQVVQGFQSGKTSSVPGVCVPPASKGSPLYGFGPHDMRAMRAILTQPAKNRLARPTRNPLVNRWA